MSKVSFEFFFLNFRFRFCLAHGKFNGRQINFFSETQESLAKLFSLALFKYLEKTKLVKNENERVPLPEFPVDEIQLDSISLRISNESEIANLIHGELDLW